MKLGSHCRYDLLNEVEQVEWRKRRADALKATKRNEMRAVRLTEAAKALHEEGVALAKEQNAQQKQLSAREDELCSKEGVLELFEAAAGILSEAHLSNFPKAFAEAVVSGALHTGSLYAQRLSDAATNLNQAVNRRWMHSESVKIVMAIAKSRQSGGSALDVLRGDTQNRAFMGDPLPSDATLNRVFRRLTAETKPGTFLTGNLVSFVALLGKESAEAAKGAALSAEVALAALLSEAMDCEEPEEPWAKQAAAYASEAMRAAGVAATMAVVEQRRLAEDAKKEAEHQRQEVTESESVASPPAAQSSSSMRKAASTKGAKGRKQPQPVAAAAAIEAVAAANCARAAAEQARLADVARIQVESAAIQAAVATVQVKAPVSAELQLAMSGGQCRVVLLVRPALWVAATAAANCAQLAVAVEGLHAAHAAAAAPLELKVWEPAIAPVPVGVRADATDTREEKHIDPKTGAFSGDVDLRAIGSINPDALEARYKELLEGVTRFIDGDPTALSKEEADGLAAGAIGEQTIVEAVAFYCEHYNAAAQALVEISGEMERKSVFYQKKNANRSAKALGKASKKRITKAAAAPEKFGVADVLDTSAMNGDTAKLLVTRTVRATFPGSDDPDTVYYGIVKRVHSADEAGVEDVVWMLISFEDGETQSYSMAETLQMLVPFASMKPRLELLLKVLLGYIG